MKMTTLPFIVFFVAIFVSANTLQLPSFFKICNRDDPNLNKCLKESIKLVMPKLADGYKDGNLNIPSIDPFLVKESKFEGKQNQFSVKVLLKNSKFIGLSKAKVTGVRANIDDNFMDLEIDMSCDRFFNEGFMNGEGRVNSIVLAVKGNYNVTMTDLTWTWKLYGETEIRDGINYMKVTKFFYRPEIGNMKINLPVLFKNSPEIDNFVKDFANTYWRAIYREILPSVESFWFKVGVKMSNKIFSKIPYTELFPTSF